MFVRRGLVAVAGVVVSCGLTVGAVAQGKQLTTEDYARAEKFMGYNVNSLVYHGVSRVNWMGDGRFWYRDNGPDGVTIVLVDPAKGTKAPAFDQVKLAAALTAASQGKTKVDPQHLNFTELEFSDGDKTVTVTNGPRKYRCDLSGKGDCAEVIVPGARSGRVWRREESRRDGCFAGQDEGCVYS